mgnify:CR=1 FL=1|tara:strand:+ start:205 stop:495 length:291 start_codon:yes stop_codon:yes gene_type:complete
MKGRKFSESQIVKILKEYESGLSASQLSRKHGVGESTIYTWRNRYGGMSVSELKRLKDLEAENRRLKQMYATLSMDHEIIKEVLEKKYDVDVSKEL